MSVLEMNRAAAGAETRPRVPWVLLIFVTAAFLVIEHDFSAPKMFQQMMTAQSLDEFEEISSMFVPRAWRQLGGLSLGALGMAAFLMRRRSGTQTYDMLGGLMLFFLGWCALSLLWSDEPGQSLRRLILLTMLGVGAAGLASITTPRDLLALAVFAPLVYLAAGLAAEIRAGTFQPLEATFRFAGTMHPNQGAINWALLFFGAWALWKGAARHRRWLLLLVIIAFGLVYLTKSRTALASLVAVMLVQYGMSRGRSGKVALASCAIALAVLFTLVGPYLFSSVPEGVTFRRGGEREAFGTLTGRTQLWRQLAGFYEDKPVLGYGYGAFWNETRSWDVMDEQGWPISHAHNAYFDTLLESGPVGFLAYVLILILGIRRAFVYYWRTGNTTYWFFASVLLFCALDGMLESVPILRGALTFFALSILAYLAFHRAPEAAATSESPA